VKASRSSSSRRATWNGRSRRLPSCLSERTRSKDGSFKNKIGTRPLTEAARRLGIRTLVACELLKLAPIPAPSVEDEPELRDTTPSEFVDEIVTEEGPLAPEDVKSQIARTPFLRDGYRLLR
jgi:methylthioribose-1-phosphate isomerase